MRRLVLLMIALISGPACAGRNPTIAPPAVPTRDPTVSENASEEAPPRIALRAYVGIGTLEPLTEPLLSTQDALVGMTVPGPDARPIRIGRRTDTEPGAQPRPGETWVSASLIPGEKEDQLEFWVWIHRGPRSGEGAHMVLMRYGGKWTVYSIKGRGVS